MIGRMAPVTNLSATKRTVAALRRRSRLGAEHAGLVMLASSTARALDEVVAGDVKPYVIPQLARAHLLALQALLGLEPGTTVDPFTAFVAGLATPSVDSAVDFSAVE
jgi:hypothetical protein